MDLEVIVVKGYCTLSISPKLEDNQQMQFSVIPRTPHSWGRGLIPQQGDTISVFCSIGREDYSILGD